MAFNHAKARRVALELEDSKVVQPRCPCCGFSVNRKPLNFCSEIKDFGFLGAGYSMMYNLLKYFMIFVSVDLFIKGIYNLATYS